MGSKKCNVGLVWYDYILSKIVSHSLTSSDKTTENDEVHEKTDHLAVYYEFCKKFVIDLTV